MDQKNNNLDYYYTYKKIYNYNNYSKVLFILFLILFILYILVTIKNLN
jgi:hypothetical protein